MGSFSVVCTMQTDNDNKDQTEKNKDKIVVGQTNFDVFDAVLDGGLAVTFVSDSNVKTCAIFKFGGTEFDVVELSHEVECEGGMAIVVSSENGTRWSYKENANGDL